MNKHGFRVQWALIALEGIDCERLHVVSAELPVLLHDETVRHRLSKLDYRNYSAIPRRVDLRKLFGKSVGLCHVAPLSASRVGNPNTGLRPYGGQQLDFVPVGVLDRYCQFARAYGVLWEPPPNRVPYVCYDLGRRLVHKRGLVHYQKDIDVTEASHVRALPDGTAEHGLHYMVAFLPKETTQTLKVSRDSLLIRAGVPCE